MFGFWFHARIAQAWCHCSNQLISRFFVSITTTFRSEAYANHQYRILYCMYTQKAVEFCIQTESRTQAKYKIGFTSITKHFKILSNEQQIVFTKKCCFHTFLPDCFFKLKITNFLTDLLIYFYLSLLYGWRSAAKGSGSGHAAVHSIRQSTPGIRCQFI